MLRSQCAQLEIAPPLLVDIDATTLAPGPLTSVQNAGTSGGFFEARGGGATIPVVAPVDGRGTIGIRFDGGDYLMHLGSKGGAALKAPAGIVGVNPTCTVEIWVLNGAIDRDEVAVSWGRRGGPNGSNMAFNYGWDSAWGAVGHWGPPDMGWTSGLDVAGGYSTGVPASGVWHHLVYTYNGTIQRVYADGVLKNSETTPLNIYTLAPIIIGAQTDPDGVTVTSTLRGSMTIGKLRIHDGVLSATQIAANYNLESPGFTNGPGSTLAAGPTHRYSFNNPAGSSTAGAIIEDSAGLAPGIVKGSGASFNGNVLTLPGGSSATAAYVDLPNGLLSENSVVKGGTGEVTIEGWAKVTASRAWSRLFDFGSSIGGQGKDFLAYLAQYNTDTHTRSLQVANLDAAGGTGGGGEIIHGSTTFGRDFHFAMTWNDSNHEIRVYENGSFVGRRTESARLSQINDTNVWLGRSQFTTDLNLQGQLNEFRIYNRVLSDAEIRGDYLGGPDVLTSPAGQVQPLPLGTAPFHSAGVFKVQEYNQNAPDALSAVAGARFEAYAFTKPLPNDSLTGRFMFDFDPVGGGFASDYELTSLLLQTIEPINDYESRRLYVQPTPFQFPQPPPVHFASRAELDAAWPDKPYTFDLQEMIVDPNSGTTFNSLGLVELPLSAPSTPHPPTIANFARLQSWPRTLPLEIQWNPIPGAGFGDFMLIQIYREYQLGPGGSTFTRKVTPLGGEPGAILPSAANYTDPDSNGLALTEGSFATITYFDVNQMKTQDFQGCIGISGAAWETRIPIRFVDPISPVISVSGEQKPEGTGASAASLTFEVRLSTPSNTEVSVHYSTADGTAKAGEDFQPISGTLVFAPGETVKTVAVPIVPDDAQELDEAFQLVISSPVIGSLGTTVAEGAILNDDGTSNTPPAVALPIPDIHGAYGASFSWTIPEGSFVDPDPGQVLTYAATGLPPGLGFTGASRSFSGTPTLAGAFPVTINVTDDAVPPADVNDTFLMTIDKAPLSVTADDLVRFVGDPNPVLTGKISGLLNGDAVTAKYSTTASLDSAPGPYAITAELVDPDGRLPNYEVTVTPGTLTIEAAPQIELQASTEGGLVTLAWPAASGGFVLEQVEDLTASTQWTPLEGGIREENGLRLFTVVPDPATKVRLYRLRRP